MTVKLRYKIVVEGTYEIDPIECGYDTMDADEIANQERSWAEQDIGEFLLVLRDKEWDTTDSTVDTREVIILPV